MSVYHFKPAKMTVNITRASKVNRMLIKHLFSPFDGCEQVNLLKNVQARNHTLRTFAVSPLVPIC